MIFGDLSSYTVLLPTRVLLGHDSGCCRASSPAAHAVLGDTWWGESAESGPAGIGCDFPDRVRAG